MDRKLRKAKVTPETKAEAARLKEIWFAQKERLSQVVFGETYQIGSQSAVTSFLNGHTPLSLKAAKGFAKGLGCPISAFSARLATEVDEASAANHGARTNTDRTWPFLTVTQTQYFEVLTQTQRDILEATASSFVGTREPPVKHESPALKPANIQSA